MPQSAAMESVTRGSQGCITGGREINSSLAGAAPAPEGRLLSVRLTSLHPRIQGPGPGEGVLGGSHTTLLGPSASSPRSSLCRGLVAVCLQKADRRGAGTPLLQLARSQAVICNKAALQVVTGRVTHLPRLWLANLLHRPRSGKRKESRLHYLKRKHIFNQEAQNLQLGRNVPSLSPRPEVGRSLSFSSLGGSFLLLQSILFHMPSVRSPTGDVPRACSVQDSDSYPALAGGDPEEEAKWPAHGTEAFLGHSASKGLSLIEFSLSFLKLPRGTDHKVWRPPVV